MKYLIYLLLLLCPLASMKAQKSFDKEVKAISRQIENITTEQKEWLRLEVESLNTKVDNNELTAAQGEELKKVAAQKCATNIEEKIIPLEAELQQLVKDKVEAKYDKDTPVVSSDDDDDDNNFKFEWKTKNKKKIKGESRTTSQFVFAIGLNNMVTDGDLSSIENNAIQFNNSRFYEWGFTWKTRIVPTSNLLQLKYGLSFTYNNLRPKDNQYFVANGDQTSLATHPFTLSKEPFFRTINMVVPVHLEFDFSKKRIVDEKTILKSQKGVRLGIGGYAGINLSTKQKLEYKEGSFRHEETIKGDYNTSDLVYGLSGYIGYRDVSFYAKYDLNPIFTDNVTDQNNISFGVRFDFN